MKRYLANPVAQFLAAGLVVLAVVLLGTIQLSRRAADDAAVMDARSTTILLARSVAQPAIPRGLVDGDPAAVRAFDRIALSRLLVGDVRRIKIWRSDGRIVYSDEPRLIGNRFLLGEDEHEVLENGKSEAEISDLGEPENRFESGTDDLLEVYTRVRSPEGPPLLFEAYFTAKDIAKRRSQVYDAFQPISAGGLLVLVVVTTPLLWVLKRRLDRTAHDRERLLLATADASESERRRIARDLHDGVVQDLAGTSFALSATVRDARTAPELVERLQPMSRSLQSSLRSLRSLLVEIYPPDLRVDGLGAALQDLVAPATTAGITPTVEVFDVSDASDDAVRLVWRVAQEAVRNTIRHSGATHLSVQVRSIGDMLVLHATDDGDGFQPRSDSGGLGLRGLRDLVREAGGRIDVRTAAGAGTTVHLEVPR